MVEAIESPSTRRSVSGRPVSKTASSAPDAPGLGIELNEDVAAAHPVTADRLHLEMQEAPCDWQNGNSFARWVSRLNCAASLHSLPFFGSVAPTGLRP
jgi:galactonate dehydratase